MLDVQRHRVNKINQIPSAASHSAWMPLPPPTSTMLAGAGGSSLRNTSWVRSNSSRPVPTLKRRSSWPCS
ncbi:hypothetical protein ACFQZC_08410 [Streptacidiphilus monticola]